MTIFARLKFALLFFYTVSIFFSEQNYSHIGHQTYFQNTQLLFSLEINFHGRSYQHVFSNTDKTKETKINTIITFSLNKLSLQLSTNQKFISTKILKQKVIQNSSNVLNCTKIDKLSTINVGRKEKWNFRHHMFVCLFVFSFFFSA